MAICHSFVFEWIPGDPAGWQKGSHEPGVIDGHADTGPAYKPRSVRRIASNPLDGHLSSGRIAPAVVRPTRRW